MKRPPYYRPTFDIFAPLYDLGVWFTGLWIGGEKNLRRAVVAAINPQPGQKMLEVCCGTATLSLIAAEKGIEVFGLDIARGMLQVAQEKADREKINVRLVQADAVSIPFKDKIFDRVAVSMGLHEIPFVLTRTIMREVKRILKDKGKFIIFDYHKSEGIAGFLEKIFLTFAEHDTAREFIRSDMQRELREAGFKKFERRLLVKGVLQLITVEV